MLGVWDSAYVFTVSVFPTLEYHTFNYLVSYWYNIIAS